MGTHFSTKYKTYLKKMADLIISSSDGNTPEHEQF